MPTNSAYNTLKQLLSLNDTYYYGNLYFCVQFEIGIPSVSLWAFSIFKWATLAQEK